ncbi:MAG: ABC transporter substrate-binding protein, partial [Gammaproteobacteria bacterium]|nr:ABC transporter substrate-binding protein [Gammaproteobacteria bacterium]
LLNKHKVELRSYPDDVLQQLRKASQEVVAELAKKDAFSAKVYASYEKFLSDSIAFSTVSDQAYLNARAEK